ncbi:15574_t:CDS:2 [Cetraspora pellucida]|uniref:15574_t:CDS:1 n=1 Tax=Cetraspora pellucida TaxID=1433469 RepID=A0A9N8VJM3_9GLOM|nr:15574_t:CDS:2 [Cetraspora pellucida]
MRILKSENKLYATCYYNTQFQNFSSGNQDIDNLIKSTHSNQPRFRLSWIPLIEFIDIKRIGTVVLKVLKDSSTIDSAFLKELQNIVKSQPILLYAVLFNVMESTLMQKCWRSDPLKRPSINEIDHEIYSKINSKYWTINENFIQAENKWQELLNSGKFIVRYMHPHSKTHSQILNPTIDFMHSDLIQSSNSSTSSSIVSLHSIGDYYSFNIIGTNDLSTSISLSVSKKHTTEFLLANKSMKFTYKSYQTIGQEVPNSQTNNLSVSDALKQVTTLGDLSIDDMLNYEAGKALAKALNMNSTLKYLDLSSKNLLNGSGKALAETLCNNITLTSLNLEKNHLTDEAGKALAKALHINTTLTYSNNLGESAGKALVEALCKNSTLTHLNLYNNNLGKSAGKALAELLCINTTLTDLNLSVNNNLGELAGKALAEALCKKYYVS